MGILTDLVVADPSEADVVLKASVHAPQWPALEAKSVDTIKLATLAFILEGKPLDVDHVVTFSAFQQLASKGEGGPWVFLVPASLTSRLASVEDPQLLNVADAWLQTEELQMDGWASDDTVPFLREFKALAVKAVAVGKPLLLWLSL